MTGHKPTAHMEIDSTKFTTAEQKAKLAALERVLYGADATEGKGSVGDDDYVAPTAAVEAHLPTPDDIFYILENGVERAA